MTYSNKIVKKHSTDIFTRLRPLFSVIFDWLTIEPIWRGYKLYGTRLAAVVGFFLIFLWYFVLAIPLVIIGLLLSLPGIISEGAVMGTVAPVAFIGAVLLTGYGGYRAWSLLDDRKTLFGYLENPDRQKVVDSFDYLDRDDWMTRALAADLIATGMEHQPRDIVNELSMPPSQVIFEIADLLHDKSVDVRQSGSEALAYLSKEYPEEIAKYRDDVYSGITYPDSVVQANCSVVSGDLAYYEPALADEAVQHVSAVVDDPDPDVRAFAAMALGQMHTRKARNLLQMLQNDEDAEVRQQASEALQAHERRAQTETEARTERANV